MKFFCFVQCFVYTRRRFGKNACFPAAVVAHVTFNLSAIHSATTAVQLSRPKREFNFKCVEKVLLFLRYFTRSNSRSFDNWRVTVEFLNNQPVCHGETSGFTAFKTIVTSNKDERRQIYNKLFTGKKNWKWQKTQVLIFCS